MTIQEQGAPAELMRLLYLAAEQNPLPIMIVDRSGCLVFVNQALAQLTGYAVSELMGVSFSVLHSGENCNALLEGIWACLQEGRSWEGKLLERGKDGRSCTASLTVFPLRTNDSEITHFLAIQQSMASCHGTAEHGEDLDAFDQLTGLPDRIHLLACLTNFLEKASVAGSQLTVIYLDLDSFKNINDSMGYAVADEILIAVAKRLRAVVRRDDVVARVTGDEFVLLLCNTMAETQLAEAVSRVQAIFSEPFLVPQGQEVVLTVSLGLAVYPGDGQENDTLLRAAHLAMTAVKRMGGNGVQRYIPEMQAHITARFDLAGQLRRAVERGELVLYYQPQVSLVSGEIVGAEALVRWQHPEKGLVMPVQFIPFAEESGLILPISDWVIRESCRQMAEWRKAGLPLLKVGVNLSAHHFHLASLPDTVAAALADNGVDARFLELELTESAMMRDAAGAVRIMDRLKRLGVHLSLDDFGTGFSSLAYLSRFAIDLIKIDQSFIRDLTSNPVNASIVTATIAMAHKLGKNVIAEGVETEAQMVFLRRHDCDQMQGFLFSRPVPASDFAVLLRDRRRQIFEGEHRYSGSRTLLLVDDEPRIMSALKRLFRREGYHVLTANSGEEALRLLALNQVQVIISDQRMPEMTGIELLSRVKDLYPDTIRIVLSGYAEIETVTDAINRGAVWKYLVKPWDEEKLREEVRHAFRLGGVIDSLE